MLRRLRWLKRWGQRSLQARQLLAASLSLVAFLALAGYALNAAFADTAEKNLRERLKNYATAYANSIEFLRDGSLYISSDKPTPDPHFDVPGGGLYAEVIWPNSNWRSLSGEGPLLPPSGGMLGPRQEEFQGPLDMVQIDGHKARVYRYGIGLIWSGTGNIQEEFPYTIYVMEDEASLGAQLRVFRAAVWFYLGSAGIVLMLLQAFILQWSLRPLRSVINELIKVQRGQIQGMSRQHPRELAPLTESINALIESERKNLLRQRNTLADLAHSLKTPLAVLKTQLDNRVEGVGLREELDIQLRRMNDLVSYQLARAATGGHKLFSAPIAIDSSAEGIVRGLEKVYALKNILCEFEIDSKACFYGEPGDLQELLGNLLENAFKWANHRVLLSAQLDGADSEQRSGLIVTVDDDGPGIAPEDVAKLLQRGVRGDERVHGHGIGLSIVQDIVNDYQGELRVVRSEELGGARFEVRLSPGL